MKNYVYLTALLIAFVFTGCEDEDLGKNLNIQDGDEIVFTADASYENNDTRTSYDPYEPQSGTQGISWENGDRVEIYSPESNETNQVVYEITNIQSTDKSYASLSKFNTETAGLTWGNGTQHFYAVYPDKEKISNQAVKNYVKFEEGKLTGYVPINQLHDISYNNGTWTATPTMEYGFMTAVTTVPESERENGVTLNFKPIVTALDITLVGNSTSVELSSVNISSESHQLTGEFVCDLTQQLNSGEYPTCEIVNDDMRRNIVTVDMRYGTGYNYVTLNAGESITLTVFLLPVDNLDDLSVSVSAINKASKTLELKNGEGINIKLSPHKKTMITATLPTWAADDPNTWISSLDSNTYISQLSIPGTAKSASYAYENKRNPQYANYFKSQVASIESQLAAGVRCFELRCEGNTNMEDCELMCNREGVDITFGSVMEQFADFLKDHPGEFIIVMPSYESNAGTGGALTFIQNLNSYIQRNPHGLDFGVYNRDKTINDVKGQVLIMARVTSEEYSGNLLQQIRNEGIENGLVIEEWGSLYDNWGRRGYAKDGKRVHNWATHYAATDAATGNPIMEYYMLNGNNSIDFSGIADIPTHSMNNDFFHDSYKSEGEPGTAYIQDWQRVVDGDYNYEIARWTTGWPFESHYQYAYWPDSKGEKEDDIWNTFLLSIKDNGGKLGEYFYINCIDGYFVDPGVMLPDNPNDNRSNNKPISCVPYLASGSPTDEISFSNGGVGGNIADFAVHFNDWFYQEIRQYGTENISGAMNIILLDRVLDGTEAGNGIVQIIIDNNFKFPLLRKNN